jgi:hypothetical protein
VSVNSNNENSSVRCRALSQAFIKELAEGGRYHQLIELVKKNKDLHLEFQGNLDLTNKNDCLPKDESIIILYKGNGALKLSRTGKITVAPVFIKGLVELGLPTPLLTKEDVSKYIGFFPQILFNIASHGKTSMEIEYEQLIVRSNNFEHKLFPEYIVIYSQYKVGTDRFDLLAIKWEQRTRHKKDATGKLALIEVKYGLNPDIKNGNDQVQRYYNYLSKNMESMCNEMELILKQKLQLGLIDRGSDQKQKLFGMQLERDPKTLEIIFFLVDYNPNSTLEGTMEAKAKELKFAKQIRIAKGGFCMWDQTSQPLMEIGTKKRMTDDRVLFFAETLDQNWAKFENYLNLGRLELEKLITKIKHEAEVQKPAFANEQIWTFLMACGYALSGEAGLKELTRVLTGSDLPLPAKPKIWIEVSPLPPRQKEGNAFVDLALGTISRRSPTKSGIELDFSDNGWVCFCEMKYDSDISPKTTYDVNRNQLLRVIENALCFQNAGKLADKIYVTLVTRRESRSESNHKKYNKILDEYLNNPHSLAEQLQDSQHGIRNQTDWHYPEDLEKRILNLKLNWVSYEELFSRMPAPSEFGLNQVYQEIQHIWKY